MSAIHYESNTILDIVSQMKKVDLRLTIDDYMRIKNLGILRRDKQIGRVKRGAGHKRDREIDLITGCNAKNLVKYQEKTMTQIFLQLGALMFALYATRYQTLLPVSLMITMTLVWLQRPG